jgi:ribosome-associated toxin RatA of RatAB toxin-antitoxin module
LNNKRKTYKKLLIIIYSKKEITRNMYSGILKVKEEFITKNRAKKRLVIEMQLKNNFKQLNI